MNVNLHIERLVIDGLSVGGRDGPLIEAALAAEITRLIGEGGLDGRLDHGRALPLIRTEPIARPAADAAGLGRQIGRALVGGIGQ